jgi:hypothetical protein
MCTHLMFNEYLQNEFGLESIEQFAVTLEKSVHEYKLVCFHYERIWMNYGWTR